ncbi:MAG: sulfotransferase family 2 domain-containing protein [Gammaproteobacteria bacterium]
MNTINYRDLSIICIAKNGTTSIRDAMLRAKGIERADIIDFSDLDMTYPEDATGHRVCFIRHPVQRALSCWRSKLQSKEVAGRSQHLVKAGFTVGCSLDKFIMDLRSKRHLDKHTDEQWKYVQNFADEYFRFEHIQHHWRILQDRFTWLPALGHWNSTDATAVPVHLADEIKSIYRIDMMLWTVLEKWKP